MTKKTSVIVIVVVTIMAFGIAVFIGFNRIGKSDNMPEPARRVALAVPFFDTTIDLGEGLGRDIWDSMTSQEIELTHQVMVLPWGKSVVSPLRVKAFHNNKDIYFYLTWKDNSEDRVHAPGKFSDASAIMFPPDQEVPASTLMMGFMGKTNIWHWKASVDAEYWVMNLPGEKVYTDFYYPFEEEEVLSVSKTIPQSAVSDLMSIKLGTITPKEKQGIQGKGIWENGIWQIVIKRTLDLPEVSEFDTVFTEKEKKLCAFAVWDGSNGDRGGRKSISDWVLLEVKK